MYTVHLLRELTCRLPKVKFLAFNSAHVTDDVLINIGKFCTDLETLTLANCFNVTDAGINSLCPTEENDGSIRKNKVLKHLDISDTSVSIVGVAFVLKNFPNLVTIQHVGVLTAIYNIHSDDIKNNSVEQFETYKVQELVIGHEDRFMDVNFFKMCPLLCPNVTKLTVVKITSQAQIDACVGFTELKEVYFMSTFPSAELSSFVEVRGNSLEVLRVREGNISVELLLKFCPKLKWLNLENINFEPLRELNDDNVSRHKFQNLKLLSFDRVSFSHEDVVKSVNLILSSSPNLETLHLIFVESLTLEFVNSIAECECMRTLQEIDASFSDICFAAAKKLILITPNLNAFNVQDSDLTFEEYVDLQELRPSIRLDWRSDSSEYSDYNNEFDRYDDLFDNDYDYFDYEGENEYDDDYYSEFMEDL